MTEDADHLHCMKCGTVCPFTDALRHQLRASQARDVEWLCSKCYKVERRKEDKKELSRRI